MTDPLQALLKPGALEANLFAPTSRYYGVATATYTHADGEAAVYLRRRFVPPPGAFATLQEHTVAEGERLDHLAARYLGDAALFWRLCDANAALHPADLEATGQQLRITLPAGLPGPQQSE